MYALSLRRNVYLPVLREDLADLSVESEAAPSLRSVRTLRGNVRSSRSQLPPPFFVSQSEWMHPALFTEAVDDAGLLRHLLHAAN